jgi:small-conductance mechanosensitive channel
VSKGFSAPRGHGEAADGWTGSEEPTLPEFETPAPPASKVRALSRRRLEIAALALLQLALVGGLLAVGYVAWTNHDRAGRWQDRAATLERNAAALNKVLVARSETLNERTRELNAMATKVRESQQALRRSESDVATLARRQRELANEKAQVEDARAAVAAQASELEDVAAAYVDCKDGLIDLLGYLARDDFASANAAVDAVSTDCEYADETLSAYMSSYG